MARYDCEIETKEKMFKAKDKIEPHTNITEMLAVILYVSTGPKQRESFPCKLCLNRKFAKCPKLH